MRSCLASASTSSSEIVWRRPRPVLRPQDPRRAAKLQALRRLLADLPANETAVFEDERALTVKDEITAVDETRMLTLGRDAMGRVLVVAYTCRAKGLRLISARQATPSERLQYRRKET